MRVMIVDDHKGFRAWLRDLLVARGHDCLECPDGLCALVSWSAWQPSWILLDLRMPGLDGLETLLALRRGGCTATVAILTAHNDPESPLRALASGAQAFFCKDSIQGLLARIEATTTE
ncbi:MAG: response regulator transcription factor [Verrucomicrobiales bacterium]|nr:response regulator transcription factor [Verrucomicrobiales bacterium]